MELQIILLGITLASEPPAVFELVVTQMVSLLGGNRREQGSFGGVGDTDQIAAANTVTAAAAADFELDALRMSKKIEVSLADASVVFAKAEGHDRNDSIMLECGMATFERIPNYREFWKYYVGEHSNSTNRWLHFVGTSLVIGCVLAGLLVSRKWFIAMPFAGYGFAWFGHAVFEKNRPATFRHPLWSLVADFNMFGLIFTDRMGPEVELYSKPAGRAGST
jgi:hypothetical protein